MKKKTETTAKPEKTAVQSDYSALLPLLCVALRLPIEAATAYIMMPAYGRGIVYAVAAETGLQTGILDISLDDSNQIAPGAFGLLRAEGVQTYAEVLGFLERFGSVEVSRDEVAQLFE